MKFFTHLPFFFTDKAGLFRNDLTAILNSSIRVVGSIEPKPYDALRIGSSIVKSSVHVICLDGYLGSIGLLRSASRP